MSHRYRPGIRFKILAASLAAIAVSGIAISVASVRISSSVLREKMEASASEVLSLAARDTAAILENIVRFTDYIALVDEVDEVLRGESRTDSEAFYLKKRVDTALERFSVSAVQPFIRSLKIIGTAGASISFGSEVYFLDVPRIENLIKQLTATNPVEEGVWLGIHEQFDVLGRRDDYVVSYVRSLTTAETGTPLGTVYVSFDAQIISGTLPAIDTIGGTIHVADQSGRIVAGAGSENAMARIDEVAPPESRRRAAPFVVSETIDGANWTVHYIVGAEAWTRQRQGIIFVTALAVAITLLGTAAVELVLVRSITRPLEALSTTMARVRDGDLGARYEYHANDEIGTMVTTFNYMVGKITNLLETELESERKKRNAEFAALQAKMNPHFIHNTLSTIRWMSLLHDAKPVANAIEILGRLLARTAYARGELTTIDDELASLEDYVAIQKLRYKGKFEVDVSVDPSALACECPRFTLQPIVENSIFHGIQPKRGTGVIRVRAQRGGGIVILTVSDDGIGYPEKPPNDGSDHLGLANLHERIRLHYGDAFGLSIDSDHESYTTVSVRLPVVEHEPGE